jgi:hypothetical protein
MSVTKKHPSDTAGRRPAGQAAPSGPKAAGTVKPARAGKAGSADSYILSAPRGARTISHRQIKTAVEKVFRERAEANG